MEKKLMTGLFIGVCIVVIGGFLSSPIGWNVAKFPVVFLDNKTGLPIYFAVSDEGAAGFVFPDNEEFITLALDWNTNPNKYDTVIIRGVRTPWEKQHLLQTEKLFVKKEN